MFAGGFISTHLSVWGRTLSAGVCVCEVEHLHTSCYIINTNIAICCIRGESTNGGIVLAAKIRLA